MECQYHKGYALPVAETRDTKCTKCGSVLQTTIKTYACKVCKRIYDDQGQEVMPSLPVPLLPPPSPPIPAEVLVPKKPTVAPTEEKAKG